MDSQRHRPASSASRRRGASAARRPLRKRITRWIGRIILWSFAISLALVLLYRFVPPPVTLTMLGGALQGRGITKDWMSLSDMDPDMARAAIAGEDAGFCGHWGFEPKAIAAAYQRNAQGGRIRGGSTISQQTAKNVFLIQGGGYPRKALEAYFTVLIEAIWGKRRIMEVYLNVAETGIGTYGVNEGAKRYFGHDASRLSPTEAARIAAVLPLPQRRAAVEPRGFTRRHGNTIARYVGVVQRSGLDACVR